MGRRSRSAIQPRPRDRRRDERRHRPPGGAAGARLRPARRDHGRAGRLGGQSGGVARVIWASRSISWRGSAQRTSRRNRPGFGRPAFRPTSPPIPTIQTGRLVAMIDPDGERSFLTDRGANDALCADDIPDALIAGASHIHISGYSLFAASPRAAILDVMRRAGETPVSIDPASAGFLREVGPEEFPRLDEGRCDALSQRGRGGGPLRRERPGASVRAPRRALSSRRHQAWRCRLLCRGGRGALAGCGAESRRPRYDRRRRRLPGRLPRSYSSVGTQIPEALRRAVAAGSATACKIGGRPSAKAPRDDPRPD